MEQAKITSVSVFFQTQFFKDFTRVLNEKTGSKHFSLMNKNREGNLVSRQLKLDKERSNESV